ncbi:sulfatase-like hydrolase/transferase [Marinobacter salicampi]|uniref:sulfatase-like hydrolase/transferase n=1 Tax=Marinobacter salicampi TaxID=435907 RepID=UPI00140E55C2|nr:sulfatase-like hydrolase/transferase [Marinobacter salicampi]
MYRLLVTLILVNVLILALQLPDFPDMHWVTVEAFLVTALFCLIPPGPGRRLAGYAAGALFGLLALAAIADALVRQALGRSLNLYLDASLLGSGHELLQSNLGYGLALLTVALGALVIVALVVLVGRLLDRSGPLRSATRRQALALMAVGVGLSMLAAAGVPGIGAPAAGWVANQASLALSTAEATDTFRTRMADPGRNAASGSLDGLAGRDVILGFVESYGISTLTDARYRTVIDRRLATMAQSLEAAGLHVVTGRLSSPVQGGQSWLAHGTLLSGQWVNSQLDYEILLASDFPTLIDDFNATGYRTVAVMPAITRAWPEGRLFGYDEIYDATSMDYQGPPLNWVTMPDQYTWSWFQSRVREKTDTPLFAELALISSHAPWVPVLPVLEWDRIGDGSVFEQWADAGEAPVDLWRDHDRVRDHYVRAVDYALNVVTGYATRFLDESTLLIVLGDHQPAPMITGDDASRDVPVHLISGDQALLASFLSPRLDGGPDGLPTFRQGTRPEMTGEALTMAEFRPFLHRRFGGVRK